MNIANYSDEVLLSRFREGDAKSFDELIGRYQVMAFSLALNLLGNQAHASEVVKEVFVELSRRVKKESNTSFELLVHRATYDLALSWMMFGFASTDTFGIQGVAESPSPDEATASASNIVGTEHSSESCLFNFTGDLTESLEPDALENMQAIGFTNPLLESDELDQGSASVGNPH